MLEGAGVLRTRYRSVSRWVLGLARIRVRATDPGFRCAPPWAIEIRSYATDAKGVRNDCGPLAPPPDSYTPNSRCTSKTTRILAPHQSYVESQHSRIYDSESRATIMDAIAVVGPCSEHQLDKRNVLSALSCRRYGAL